MKARQFRACLMSGAVAVALVACGGSADSATKTDDGRTVVTFWHSMRGTIAENLESYADDFNASQDEIWVDASFQGTYSEATTKLKQVLGTSEAPTLMQLRETTTREMIDTGGIVPMQEFVDADGYDTSAFEGNILAYYTIDDQLYSMPMNASNAIVVYNKDAFREVGLDPESPPRTFSEFKDAAAALTIKDGATTKRYGMTLQIYGWIIGQIVSNQGGLIVNNDNGRSGPPTEAVFNGPEGLRTMEWINDMYNEGYMGNFGSVSDDMVAAFFNGDTAMFAHTTARVVEYVTDAPFEVGTAYLPVPDGVEATGPVIGGASLWIFEDAHEEEQEAAFEFVKYLLSPEVQAHWAANTGYFPITTEAYEQPVLADQLAAMPQIQTAIDQLHDTAVTPASLGALTGVEYETLVADAWERMYNGDDPQAVLDAAAAEMTNALESYNRANQ